MQEDRLVVAGLAQQRYHPLALAERIGADHVAALREQFDRMQQPGDLALVRRMAEHRQAEGRLGDEHVAGHRLERRAGRIGTPLVVAGSDDPAATVFQHRLGAAKHVAGRDESDIDVADPQALAIGQRLQRCHPPHRHSGRA